MSAGWIGVDLDGTLAYYDKFKGPTMIGDPIKPMVARVQAWVAQGYDVRIFTARVWPVGMLVQDQPINAARLAEARQAEEAIKTWCLIHLGFVLPITCTKDYGMIELWDDRCVQVRANTGEPVGVSTRGLL